MPEKISVLGVAAGVRGSLADRRARRILEEADLVLGARRHIEAAEPHLTSKARALAIGAAGVPLEEAIDLAASEAGRVCFLATGDPGFFGIVRTLAERFGSSSLDVHPETSSVAIAFARLGLPWDDAAVVSCHGRDPVRAARAAARFSKVAVLTSPEANPACLGDELLRAGASFDMVIVAERLGSADEALHRLDSVTQLAAGSWDPLSVVVLARGTGVSRRASPAWPPPPWRVEWGRDTTAFAHEGSMITKPEVRAASIAKLALDPSGVLWDVGAGSGSVGIECAVLFPHLEVYAVESDIGACERIEANSARHGVAVTVVHGEAPAALADLPAPCSVFVGGGGLDVLEEIVRSLARGTRIVATFAAVDRAVCAHRILGNMVEISAAHAQRLDDGGIRLAASNPVFVAWGDTGGNDA